jgi:hypothetical protein
MSKIWPLALALALALLAGVGSAHAEERLPPVNLVVELRWVQSEVSPAALGGARDGAVVVGTAGSVSPRGAVVLSSQGSAAQRVEGEQRLLVLNGQQASVQLRRAEALQWVETTVEIDPAAATGPRRIYASPRQGERQIRQRFAVTPRWPGGQQPVRVSFSVASEGADHESTVLLPLQSWQTVARTGEAQASAERGTLSSADSTPRTQRELQIRVTPAP